MLSTNNGSSAEDPPWLKSPPKEEKSGRKSAGVDGSSRVSTPMSIGRARRSYGASQGHGYDSAADDDDADFNEDCCCCPMDPVLLGVGFFHGICLCLALAGLAVNVHHLTKHSETGQTQDILRRSYTSSFCLLMVFCEIDWRFVMRHLRLLDLWVFRGFFYVYVGLQTIGVVDTISVEVLSKSENLVGTLIAIAGVIYCFGGVCCLKSVADARRKERERTVYRELQSDANAEAQNALESV
jgi:hypothetical protein